MKDIYNMDLRGPLPLSIQNSLSKGKFQVRGRNPPLIFDQEMGVSFFIIYYSIDMWYQQLQILKINTYRSLKIYSYMHLPLLH